MNKLSLSSLVAASLLVIAGQASAAGVGADFTVSATLVPKCESTTSGTPNMDFGVYTAFGTAANAAPTATLSFKCSKSVTVSAVALSASTGTIKGLDYSLVVGAATQGTAAGADTYSYVVTGTMAAGQAGDTAGGAGPVTHTLTITY